MQASDGSDQRDKLNALQNRVQQIIETTNLADARNVVKQLAKQLNINLLDCAAALLYLHQPVLETANTANSITKKEPKPHYKLVRYRLDIGSQHQVEKEQIQAVLIQESGVDKKRIGNIDIRHNYTLVELPDGMPADIFQLLSEASINDRKLAIKRIKSNRKISNIKQNHSTSN